ncbi:MAG: hypothetical protein K2J62_04095 [Bacteroidales bacterium]|nr:hypothetical protein [Bacteroidales bacterium]
MLLKGYFRKRSLEKDSSHQPTGFIPAGMIKYMAVLLDAEEPGFEKCREAIIGYCREKGMDLNLMYVDYRRASRKAGPETDPDMTFLRSDLKWTGRPSASKASLVKDHPCDLFICLSGKTDFSIEYISCSAEARFKIGRTSFRRDPFNIVIEGDSQKTGQEEIFKAITDLLSKIE